MSDISRRDFAKLAGVGGLGALASSAWSPFAVAQGAAKVVIVGGGPAGRRWPITSRRTPRSST